METYPCLIDRQDSSLMGTVIVPLFNSHSRFELDDLVIAPFFGRQARFELNGIVLMHFFVRMSRFESKCRVPLITCAG